MPEIDEIVKEFLVESYENLDRLDRDFVALETDPTAPDKLASIFRTIHTIKGTCGCLGLPKLEAIAHVGENLLCRLRDGQLIIDTEMTTGLLRLVDAVREILSCIETTGREGDKDYSDVRDTLVKLNERPSLISASQPAAQATPEMQPTPAPVPASAVNPARLVETDSAETDASPPPSENAPSQPGPASAWKERAADSVAATALRVDVSLLDKLMNLVGELVLARNQVLQYTAIQKDATLLRTAQRLNIITTELQGGVMKTRMQPIDNLWGKYPRIVRDVSNSLGKKIRIDLQGRETELDKTILEAIKDPLTHIIRNSMDHGVEAPEQRRESGKPEEGRIFMRAFHEGGQVNIEITDDGKGIDPEAVKRKALQRGLISAEQAGRMGEREAIGLVFLPGFSTAEKITNVSGRGVGMDVVKTNVERIGGTVDIKSRIGEGTAIRIKIPLTLAIIPALVVTSGGERFAIPQVSLLELVRLEGNRGIEMINQTPLYRLRGNLLPLVYLNRELKIDPARESAGEARSSNIVVLRGGERQFGLVVDQINDTEEIVVKPLGKQLKGITVFAGATIMGDGKVALILDVMGLAQKANVISRTGDTVVRVAAAQNTGTVGERKMLLLFEVDGGQRMAIPLSAVSRLEEFRIAAVEYSGGQPVVQYRGQIMPLVDVAEIIDADRFRTHADRAGERKSGAETIQVIVYSHENQNIGLQVDRIMDVVEEFVQPQKAAARPGVLGTAIIKEKVTGLLDVQAVVRAAAVHAEPAMAA